MKDIGKRIREQRKKKGITQEAMANALGVTSQAVSKWENGQNAPDISMIMPICTFLGIGADELLGGNKNRDLNEKYFDSLIWGGEYSLVIINQALKEVPTDTVWLERKFHATMDSALHPLTEGWTERRLKDAEKILDTLTEADPDNDEYKYMRANLYLQKDMKDEVRRLAYEINDGDMIRRDILLNSCFDGEELIKHKQSQLMRAFVTYHGKLMSYNTHESIELAQTLHNRLIAPRSCHDKKRALLYLSEGNTEGFEKHAALAYELAKKEDAEPVSDYPSPMTDRLKRNAPIMKAVESFLNSFIDTPLPHEFKCRIVEDNLKFAALKIYNLNIFLHFLRFAGNFDEHMRDFSTVYDCTEEECEEDNQTIHRRIKEGHLTEAEITMIWADRARRLIKDDRMTGFIYELGEHIPVGFCNCGDRDKYTCLGIRRCPKSPYREHLAYTPEQLASVPEGSRVFSIVDMRIHQNFRWCGIEKALIDRACFWAEHDKYDYIEAYIDTDLMFMLKPDELERWIEEYKNAGFEIVKDLSEDKYTKLVLQKKL
ncbi:MAG: helix-turn-helix domain-containing protein [Clostridia bacterium]|nr:helix-turn-helix domain-containing protein [Clostridia bacterium]